MVGLHSHFNLSILQKNRVVGRRQDLDIGRRKRAHSDRLREGFGHFVVIGDSQCNPVYTAYSRRLPLNLRLTDLRKKNAALGCPAVIQSGIRRIRQGCRHVNGISGVHGISAAFNGQYFGRLLHSHIDILRARIRITISVRDRHCEAVHAALIGSDPLNRRLIDRRKKLPSRC